MGDKKFKYSVSNRIFNEKLDPEEFGLVYNSMIPTQNTIRDFSKIINRPQAHSWCGGVFSGLISKKDWIESSIIGLDFDNGVKSLSEVYKEFEQFGIIPNLHYNTFSSSQELHKFRVIFFFDVPITDEHIYTKIMVMLEKIFSIDPNCKNTSRIFYGGTDVNITNDEPVSLEQFYQFIDINASARDNLLTRSYIKSDFSSAEKCNSLYYNNKNKHFLASYNKFNYTSLPGGQTIDWDKARKKIKLLDQFLSGDWLDHLKLFGLATHMIYIRGGEKKMKETMKEFNESKKTSYTANNFAILPYVKNKHYHPVPFFKFSPYTEDNDVRDVISEVRNIRGHIKILKPIDRIGLQEAETIMVEKFNEILSNEETGKTYIFCLPTAIGKTRLLENVEKSIIALPTNNLKNEVSERMKTEHISSPDQLIFKDIFLNKKIDYYYRIGLPTKAMGVIRKVSKIGYAKFIEDTQLANDYVSRLEECNDLQKSILTTHKRILNSDLTGHDTVIFDEDPLNSLIEIKCSELDDFFSLKHLYRPMKGIVKHIDSLDNGIYSTPKFDLNFEDLFNFVQDKNIIKTNIFDFFNSSFFIKDDKFLHYIIKKDLPKEKKNIIMSATIPIGFYQKLYPDMEFECVDIRNVEQKGKIIQYTGRSCSRSGLERYGNEISKEVGNKTVITFVDHKELFQNSPNEIHFGNCSGYNTLNGMDLVIVGTPHRNNIECFLLAKLMNVEFDINKSPFRYQKVQYNDFEFMMNTFDNLELREIQFSLIESDMIQAVGRARSLRNSCLVEVYSGFPLRITSEFIIKKSS